MRERSLWRDLGAALARRGWCVTPILPPYCLKKGKCKVPGTWIGTRWIYRKDWQHDGVPSAAKLKEYQGWPPCGIGIVLGRQGNALRSVVVGVDIDVLVPAVADEIKTLALRMFGPAPERVGLWPKLLLPYRCTEEIAKRTTANYRMPGDAEDAKLHHVEILATGEQFVAFGQHQCGVRNYSWTGGSPATLTPGDLTLVTPGMLQSFLEICDGILVQAGGVVKAPPASVRPWAKGAGGDPNPALHAGLLALLKATGRVLKWQANRVDILCPFMDEHPDRGDTGTALLPGGGIKCHHATCGGRKTGDFIAKLKELAAEAGQDAPAIYDKAAHARQLEIARAEFEEIDDATLATLRPAPRPGGIQTEYQRRVHRAARARCKAQAAQADWDRLVEDAQKGQEP